MTDFVVFPNPVLQQAAQPRPVDAAMLAVGEALRAAAAGVEAFGLAAAHIGRVEPLVVISLSGPGEARDYRLLFNPTVQTKSEESAFGPEGSVSMPGIEVPVERAIRVEIGFDTAAGARELLRLEGFAACVAQHEIDQVNGVFFLNRLSRLKRDTAIRKFSKSQR